jgi:glutaredoxin
MLLLSFTANSPLADTSYLLTEEKRESNKQAVYIEVFVRSGCPHCAMAELFLQSLKKEYPTMQIVFHDIIQGLEQLANNQGIAAKAPAFWIQGQLIIG